MRCSVWREAAENVAESLTKGTRVLVQGRLVQRSYETREGEKRTVVELQVDEVGPSLRYATAKVSRSGRGAEGGRGGGWGETAPRGGGHGGPQGGSRIDYGAPAGGAVDDPWATGGATNFGDEPPF